MQRYIRLFKPLRTAFIVLAVYLALNYYGFFTIPALKTSDLFFRLRYHLSNPGESTKDIVIIEIDDSSYAGRWAWDRKIFAFLTHKLSIYSPRIIGYDLGFFDESTISHGSDFLFSESLKAAGNVILASYIDKDGRYIMPGRMFKDNALACGFTNKPEEIDGIIRNTRVFTRYALSDDILDYSFDLKVAAAFLGVPLNELEYDGKKVVCGNFKVPAGPEGLLPLNYTAKPKDFKTIRFSEVAEEKVSLDFIRDKIVLVGVTDPVFHDISHTPFGKMTGIVIIANSVTLFLNRAFLWALPSWINIIALFLCGLITGWATYKRQIYKSTIFTLAAITAVIGIGLALLKNNILWDFFSCPVVILAIYLVNSAAGYTELFLQSIKIKKMAITDPLTGLATRRYFLIRLERILKTFREHDSLCLVLFGIDNFSDLSVELGAEKTNNLIRELGDLIARSSRKTRGADLISRYGEKEFCAILFNTDVRGASAYTNRIRQIKPASALELTVSAGIVNIGDLPHRSAKLSVKSAEAALSRAREAGGKETVVYNPEKDLIPLEQYKEEKEISEIDLSYVAEEFQEKHKELAIMLNKLRVAHDEVIKSERLSAVGKVAATIHHDLSKPIVNLKGALKMVREDLDKINLSELEEAKKLISASIEETERLAKLGDSLRDLYRPMKKEFMPVKINPLLEEMLSLSGAQINKNRISLLKKLDPDLPDVSANPGELKQVFLNLIINAIESMPNGGGELEITTSVRQDTVETSIRDTGYGIAPENKDKLFKAFFTTKKGEKGAGLGLYASMEIIKKYGGRIEVESAVSKGSTFKVLLPCIK